MRIGIDARFLGYSNSGLAHYSESLLEALARRDSQNEYCAFSSTRGLIADSKLDDNFRLIPVRGRPLSLRALRRASRAINQENLDLLHVHYPVVPPLIDCPALLTVHDTPAFCPRRIGDFRPSRRAVALIVDLGILPNGAAPGTLGGMRLQRHALGPSP